MVSCELTDRQAAGASHEALLSAVQGCWTFNCAACEESDAHLCLPAVRSFGLDLCQGNTAL